MNVDVDVDVQTSGFESHNQLPVPSGESKRSEIFFSRKFV